ncbi:MAG: ABC transporter ATP-binding protein [Deltaproteobacteria bacterium]|nr:ABC transporter ATP-binding protein [Deltaproteobacteria bacterium]
MNISLKSVTKRFSGRSGEPVTVLDELTLGCTSGSVTVIDGRSGSGKSTLLNVIAGLYRPDSGEVIVGDARLHALGESARDRFRAEHVGYVFQTFNLLSPLNAVENLTVPLALAGQAEHDSEPRARQILDELGLAEEMDKRPYELSVGQRQRVAVARAVLRRPSVLLADEPTANLDADSTAAVIAALEGMVDAGATLVMATHDPLLRQAFEGAAVCSLEPEQEVAR